MGFSFSEAKGWQCVKCGSCVPLSFQTQHTCPTGDTFLDRIEYVKRASSGWFDIVYFRCGCKWWINPPGVDSQLETKDGHPWDGITVITCCGIEHNRHYQEYLDAEDEAMGG